MIRALCVLVVALATPTVTQAQVTFDEALGLAPESPSATRARRQLEARRSGDANIGGTWQATQLTVMPGALVSPDSEQGFELQVSLTQGWNLADLGGARRAAAAEERQALGARARSEALRARLDAAERWLELRTIEDLGRLLEQQGELEHARIEAMTRAAAAGMRTAHDVAEARAAEVGVEQDQHQLEAARTAASLQLSLAMGRQAQTDLTTAGPRPAPPLPGEARVRARIASLDDIPEVAARRFERAAARAREVEASATQAPVLQLGAQLERTASDAWVVFGVAGISFSAFGQGDRATSLAEAEAEVATVDAEAAVLRARADLEDALHEIEHAEHQLALVRDRMRPALREVMEVRERQLAAGEGTVFAVSEARRRDLWAQEQEIRAVGAQTWAAIRLWLLLAALEDGAPS